MLKKDLHLPSCQLIEEIHDTRTGTEISYHPLNNNIINLDKACVLQQ